MGVHDIRETKVLIDSTTEYRTLVCFVKQLRNSWKE